MEWAQFGILIITLAGLFFWNRTEARADARHFDNETKALRREMIDVMRGFQASIDAIKEESKDFHGRMCSMEERRMK